MKKQILTLDNLYEFFVQQNHNVNFSSKDAGQPIVVRTVGNFSTEDNDMPGLLGLKLKVCHTETNRNGSHISQENMEIAMPTLKYRPILAYIHELQDGTKDFYAHNMEIVENEDGESEIVYTEKQVGCFTAENPWLEYDKNMDKTYVMAHALIPEYYTEAADIIRRKNGTKVSCELVINELAYNAKEKYLDITDFYFAGATLLGCDEDGNEIGEGMLGSRADIADFCHKEPEVNYQDELIKVLNKLDITLSNFDMQKTQEGGNGEMNKFEELLEQYGVTAEDVTFETEGLSDEELEAAFEEAFGEGDTADDNADTEGSDDEGADDGSDEGESEDKETFTKNFSVELSHEDVRYSLYQLLSQYDEVDNEWYYIRNVYDSHFIFQGWCNNKLYKQPYTVDGENVAFEGDRQEMFEMILTESEKLSVEKMREDYAALESKYNELKEFKEQYEAAELQSKKDAIFAKEEYSILSEDEEFKNLVEKAAEFSVEEIETKVKSIFADHVIKTGAFSYNSDTKSTVKTVGLNFNAEPEKSGPYGNLFKK